MKQHIGRVIAFEMAALQQHGGAILVRERLRCLGHRKCVADFSSDQQPRFVQIRRDKRCEWKSFVLVTVYSCALEKTVASGCNHHRIDYQRNPLRKQPLHTCYCFCDGAHGLTGAKQTSLDRADPEVFCKHLDLLANNGRTDWLDLRNLTRDLGDNAGHRDRKSTRLKSSHVSISY